MQVVFQRHLNEQIAVYLYTMKPVQVTLLRCEPDYFTVDTNEGAWVHLPYNSVVSIVEYDAPTTVKTRPRAMVRLVVALRVSTRTIQSPLVDSSS